MVKVSVVAKKLRGGKFHGVSIITFNIGYEHIISVENLLEAWQEFIKGKKNRKDVQEFQRNLVSNILELHSDLVNKIYKHSNYEAFNISDPKPRSIHKASVRDRLLHHAIYRNLYPFFNKIFIADSYSCRNLKGTHKAILRFKYFAQKVSKNNTRTVCILKCDIKKFFASIDQKILLEILDKRIIDKDITWLLKKIIGSFYSTEEGKGLPLGNLTSQLLVNTYMNEFDQFVKHRLGEKYYMRYADDFVFMSQDHARLEEVLCKVKKFLNECLKLHLHPDKVFIKTLASGVDFLGWVHFPKYRILRSTTKKRMFMRLKINQSKETVASYLGLLKHGNTHKLRIKINNILGDTLAGSGN